MRKNQLSINVSSTKTEADLIKLVAKKHSYTVSSFYRLGARLLANALEQEKFEKIKKELDFY